LKEAALAQSHRVVVTGGPVLLMRVMVGGKA